MTPQDSNGGLGMLNRLEKSMSTDIIRSDTISETFWRVAGGLIVTGHDYGVGTIRIGHNTPMRIGAVDDPGIKCEDGVDPPPAEYVKTCKEDHLDRWVLDLLPWLEFQMTSLQCSQG